MRQGSRGLVHWDDPEGCDGREVGGELRMGNMCAPVADSCQCMVKPLQYCKVSSHQLKYINLKKAETVLCQQRSI